MLHAAETGGSPSVVTPAKFGKPLIFGAGSGRVNSCGDSTVVAGGDNSVSAVVFWLHGFGDVPEGWAEGFRSLRQKLPPSWQWIHLRAPRVPQGVGYRGQCIQGWGQFSSQAVIHVGSEDYDDKDPGGYYAASVSAIHKLIEDIGKSTGVPVERMIIGGFSQGAAVAFESAFTFPGCRLAGCVAFSGWLTTRARAALVSRKKALKDFRCLVAHGTKDDMVGFDCAEAAIKLLTEGGLQVEMVKMVGVSHSSHPQEIKALGNFLPLVLPTTGGNDTMTEEIGDTHEDDEDQSDESGPAIMFVCKSALDALRATLDSGSDPDVESVLRLKRDGDDEILVPICLDADTDLDSYEALLERVGPRCAAERIVKAANAFEDNKQDYPFIPATITGKEAKAMEVDSELSEGAESEDEDGDSDQEESEQETDDRNVDGGGKRARTNGGHA